MSNDLTPQTSIERKIFVIRGQNVMLDRDLAELYGVPTKRLNEQVRRNIKRFPEDFMFQLTRSEARSLRSQNATLKRGRHSKYLPYVFTEQGVAMLSSVLTSERAMQVNVAIMRTFVRLRRMLSAHKELACKLAELEKKIEKQDQKIIAIFEVIRQLMEPVPAPNKRNIGFHAR